MDDDPEILGEHHSRDALQAFLLVRRADLLRKEHLGRKGHQHDVAAGQRNVGGQAGPLIIIIEGRSKCWIYRIG